MQKKKLFSFHFRVHSNNKAKVKKTLTFQKTIKKKCDFIEDTFD